MIPSSSFCYLLLSELRNFVLRIFEVGVLGLKEKLQEDKKKIRSSGEFEIPACGVGGGVTDPGDFYCLFGKISKISLSLGSFWLYSQEFKGKNT